MHTVGNFISSRKTEKFRMEIIKNFDMWAEETMKKEIKVWKKFQKKAYQFITENELFFFF